MSAYIFADACSRICVLHAAGEVKIGHMLQDLNLYRDRLSFVFEILLGLIDMLNNFPYKSESVKPKS